MDLDIKVSEVIFVGNGADSWDTVRGDDSQLSKLLHEHDRRWGGRFVRFGHEALGLLDNPLWKSHFCNSYLRNGGRMVSGGVVWGGFWVRFADGSGEKSQEAKKREADVGVAACLLRVWTYI